MNRRLRLPGPVSANLNRITVNRLESTEGATAVGSVSGSFLAVYTIYVMRPVVVNRILWDAGSAGGSSVIVSFMSDNVGLGSVIYTVANPAPLTLSSTNTIVPVQGDFYLPPGTHYMLFDIFVPPGTYRYANPYFGQYFIFRGVSINNGAVDTTMGAPLRFVFRPVNIPGPTVPSKYMPF